jgi:hypothetical protein
VCSAASRKLGERSLAAVVKTLINLRVLLEPKTFFIDSATVSLSHRLVLHGVGWEFEWNVL